MITISRYNSEYSAVWDAFVDASKNGTFMLKRGYIDYHSDRFIDHSLMFYQNEILVALLPCTLHNNELRSHGGLTYGGLITSTKVSVQTVLEIFQSLIDYMKAINITTLLYKRVPSVYYKYPSDEDLYALFRVGATLIRRDISTTIYIPNKIKFSERRRRGCKQAIRNQIIVKESDDFEQYIDILSVILAKYHNTKPVHTAAELNLLASKFTNNIKLYAAYKDDAMLAGVLVYETEKVAHAQYIVNSDEGRCLGALDIVFDFLINYKYSHKDYFDFGISTEENGYLLNEGLVTQKQEFGGRGVIYDFYQIKV